MSQGAAAGQDNYRQSKGNIEPCWTEEVVLLPQLKNPQRCRLSLTGKAAPAGKWLYTATAVLSAPSPPEGIREDSDFDCGLIWMASTGGQTAPPEASYNPLSWLTRIWRRLTGNITWDTPGTTCRLATALLSGTGQRLEVVRRNHHQAVSAITMLVDSGATENCGDKEIIPEVECLLLDFTVLDKPKEILTAGQQVLLGTATGRCHHRQKAGTRHHVGLPSLIVAGLGHTIFFSSDTAARGIKPVIETGNSLLKRNGTVVPLEQRK